MADKTQQIACIVEKSLRKNINASMSSQDSPVQANPATEKAVIYVHQLHA